MLARILEGGAAIAREAGVAILGGHTIKDDEPKYGMAVSGTIDPRHIVTNANAQPGDVLVLTKPIGTGILTTAAKRDVISYDALRPAIGWMTTLNASAASRNARCAGARCNRHHRLRRARVTVASSRAHPAYGSQSTQVPSRLWTTCST